MKLEEFEAICEKATQGPWLIDFAGSDDHQCAYIALEPLSPRNQILVDHRCDYSSPGPDAKFIAAARDMVPRMIKALKAAKAEMDALHRQWEHSWGCPRCDAERSKILAFAELEQP